MNRNAKHRLEAYATFSSHAEAIITKTSFRSSIITEYDRKHQIEGSLIDMSTNPDDNSLPMGKPAPSVPTFACLVYLSQNETGTSIARVANLANLEATGASPRDAMMRVCREFKERVRTAHSVGETIEWIDPPMEPKPGEQIRSIPVHL